MCMVAKGIVRGNTVVLENNDFRLYDGNEVYVSLINTAKKKKTDDAFFEAKGKILLGLDDLNKYREENLI